MGMKEMKLEQRDYLKNDKNFWRDHVGKLQDKLPLLDMLSNLCLLGKKFLCITPHLSKIITK